MLLRKTQQEMHLMRAVSGVYFSLIFEYCIRATESSEIPPGQLRGRLPHAFNSSFFLRGGNSNLQKLRGGDQKEL